MIGMNATICPEPFLAAIDYPSTKGELSGRFCAHISSNLTCCLPCPVTAWVFSDHFNKHALAANYVSIPSFILNILLLLTFWILPEEKSHRHYLSVGLTVSLILLSLAFIVPLGTNPNMCYNKITPNNMHTDVRCGWTGAFLLAGAMGAVVWILLRSIWTALRIMFDFKRIEDFKWVCISLGTGLPVLFLALCMPVTGVSYRLGNVCLPNSQGAFVTWFIWLITFAGLSVIILATTIVYSVWKFALSTLAGGMDDTPRGMTDSTDSKRATRRSKRIEWTRIKRVLALQWRTIVLAFIVLNESIYFGIVFVQQTAAATAAAKRLSPVDEAWAACLIITSGDKNKCLTESTGLGLSEARAITTLLLASMVPLVVFLLMFRWSMLQGWWQIIQNPRSLFRLLRGRRGSLGINDFISQPSPKHISLAKPLGSDRPMGRSSAENAEGDP